MRVLRAKQIRKALKFFQMVYGFSEPYKVILDGNFIVVCLKMQMDPIAAVRKVLQLSDNDGCEFLVPEGVVKEIEILGPSFAEAAKYAREYQMAGEKAAGMSAHDHIEKIIGKNNTRHYFVATQDQELRASLRNIPGTPLLYANRTIIVLEQISRASKSHSATIESDKISADTKIQQKVEQIKRQRTSESDHIQRRVKRKAKGPNPLSMKKSTKKNNRRESKKRKISAS